VARGARRPSQRQCPLWHAQTLQDHLQKKSRIAAERDEKKRDTFREAIKQLDPTNLVFLDESGFNLALHLAYGWSPQGERLVEAVPFCRGENLSVLGAFDLGGMLCTTSKEGAMKRVDVENFLERDVLPRLLPGAVLVLDNARIHHGGRIEEIVTNAGCSVLYLPPYSPDFNPIELAWSWVKRFVRRLAPRDRPSRSAAIGAAMAALPDRFAPGWFRKCGLKGGLDQC
jgi:transposase